MVVKTSDSVINGLGKYHFDANPFEKVLHLSRLNSPPTEPKRILLTRS